MPDVQVELRETRTFWRHVNMLRLQDPEALDALRAGVDQLKADPFDTSLQIERYGRSGKSFSYEFHPEYVLTFDRETDRAPGGSKQPTAVILYLKTIQRV